MKPTWQTADGSVRLFLAECEAVRDHLQCDAIVTDPPYGMNWDTDSQRFSGGQSPNIKRPPGGGRGRSGKYGEYGPVLNDDKPFDPEPWLAITPRCAFFGFQHFACRLPLGSTLIWIKKPAALYGTFLSDADLCWIGKGHGVYVIEYSFPPPVRAVDAGGDPCRPIGVHPTQKPIAVMQRAMEILGVKSGVVCDPYMGSGSTIIGAMRLGLSAIGIEHDPKHFDTSVRRVERELSRAPLFEAPPILQRELLT